jgi:hypothetical protein
MKPTVHQHQKSNIKIVSKTTLLFLFGTAVLGQAQSIDAFYGHLAATPTDGVNQQAYAVVDSDTAVDHSPSGVNATWNFTQLSPIGPSVYSNAAPTVEETTAYPGTTMVTTNINSAGIVMTVAKLYSVANQALTGATSEATGIELNYTDNATIGTFPLDFGYTNTDAVAGTYQYLTYSGTFSGNIVSGVDAYGTLTTNDYGFGPNEIQVVRLKLVQTLNLNYLIFSDVGSVTITNYHYYMENQLFPFFTSVTTAISVPMLDISQSQTLMEASAGGSLATPVFSLNDQIRIAPNPATDFVQIGVAGGIVASAVELADVNGRVVLRQPFAEYIGIGNIGNGIYFATIETDRGLVRKKIVKE